MYIIAINKHNQEIDKININYREGLEDYYNNKSSYDFVCNCNKKTRMTIGKQLNYYVQYIFKR